MSKLSEGYEALAAASGLRFDLVNNVVYGNQGGYDILVYAHQLYAKAPFALTIHTAAKRETALAKNEAVAFRKKSKNIVSLQQTGNNLVVTMKGIRNQEKRKEALTEVLGVLLSFMREKGFAPCCSNCGKTVEEVGGYRAGGQYMHLCPDCEGVVRTSFQNEGFKRDSKKENLAAGIVGALLGSLLGVVCVILLSQMGYVAALSGVVMAVGVLKGYELLGGKLTRRGIVVSVIIMLIMTYVGDRLDWAISLQREVEEFNVLEMYRLIPWLLSEEYIDKAVYFFNLILLYLFLLLGAVPTIRGSLSSKKEQYSIARIGSASVFNSQIK